MKIPEHDESTSFPDVTPEAWRAAVVDSLGGKPFESLISQTYEGIEISPLYGRQDIGGIRVVGTIPGAPPFVRGSKASGYLAAPWFVAQENTAATPEAMNRVLSHDLAHGQTAINLVPDRPTRSGKDPDQTLPGEVGFGGVSLATVDDIDTLLRGIDLRQVPFFVRCGTSALPFLALLAAQQRRAGQSLEHLFGCLESDPLGDLAAEGTIPLALERAFDEAAMVTRWAARNAPRLRTMAIHSYPYHDAGADAVQELAYMLATGVTYIRALGERGVDAATAASRLRLDPAIGSDFFMEIAKFRAARRLWSQVLEAFGVQVESGMIAVHARTSQRNKSALDPHVNMLRVTTEALAAVLGGVDSLHVAPYDEPVRPPDDFSARIARNVQIILQEEASLTHMVDPAGGAYMVETLTETLAQKAWERFQAIEKLGGMPAALENGVVQSAIAETADRRAKNLAQRVDVLVGVNQFAAGAKLAESGDDVNLPAIYQARVRQVAEHRSRIADEATLSAALNRLAKADRSEPDDVVEAAVAAASAGATLGDIARALREPDSQGRHIAPLTPLRLAEPFELLRRKAIAYEKTHGAPPRAFLANIGPPRQHRARAEFAQGLLALGGFQVVTNDGFPTPEAAADAALKSGAPVVVICSTDEVYPDVVPALARRLRSAQPDLTLLVAGRPGEQGVAYRAAGVDDFIFVGADVVVVLNSLHEKL